MQNAVDISIVVPLLNEGRSLRELHNWILKTLKNYNYEILFIDDGSTDNSWEIVQELANEHEHTRGISFSKNYGKSQALHAGFKVAKGIYVATLDADLQDSPEEIPQMLATLKSKQLDLISGWKKKRHDSILFKNLPSKLFNWAARMVSGIPLHDFNCGIKVYRSVVVKNIDVHGEMHRYIPVLAAHKGFTKIDEQVVVHQARKYGATKYGADRFLKGFFDLLTLWFIYRFGKRPMHFFGFWGTFMLVAGFAFTLYLGIDKLYVDVTGRLITQRPEFYIALTLMIIGTQFFIAGFLGELLSRSFKHKGRYAIIAKT